uniref:Uncharacterized protein n=1 Tax=Rhizophora mucronata TaxID=61149 RepID=A0A2P2PT25_RHIMU
MHSEHTAQGERICNQFKGQSS